MENINYAILSFGKKNQGILKLVGAILSFLLALGTLIHFFNIAGFLGLSYQPVFAEIIYNVCLTLSVLLMLIGFVILGIMLLTKPKHMMVTVGLFFLAIGEFLACMENLFYYIWQSSYLFSYFYSFPYIPMIFLCLFAAVAWALPAAANHIENKAGFRNMTLVFLLLPAIILLANILIRALASVLFFNDFLYVLMEMALIAVVSILVLSGNSLGAIESLQKINKENAEKRWQEAHQTRPGQTAHQAQASTNTAAKPQAVPADGYIGIVPLIIFSIITFGIYVYIWIYKTTKFLDRRLNRQGSFSPGVEVVLCLFVPFYFIYWVYKQTKATEQAHKLAGNHGSEDLAVINLILCIVGLGIVAYALIQDQINKLCTGYTAPPSYERPQNIHTTGSGYNFDPVTGEPIRKAEPAGYNFDPMTGKPIRKAEPAAEIIEEAPEEVIEEAPEEVIEETPEKVIEEAPEELIEETPEELIEEAPEEVIEETPEEVIEETPEEVIEEASAYSEEQAENIKMLETLRDAGIISAEEFESKKNTILS